MDEIEEKMSSLTPAQYLELAKIKEFGMKQNKNFESIKQRQEKVRKEHLKEYWEFLGLEAC